MSSVADSPRPKVIILGIHGASEGYPNVLYRLKYLRESRQFDVVDISVAAWTHEGHRASLPRRAVRTLTAHLMLLRQLARAPSADLVYVPYPAVFVVNLLLLLRGRTKGWRVVTDAFISVYDTVVNDRRLVGDRHPLARLLYWMERRAYERSDLIIVDTPENAAFLRQSFGLSPEKVAAVPLSTNEIDYSPSDYCPHAGPTRILFIGTFVPLHGVQTIIEAAARLRDRPDIEFRIIGDGQHATEAERLITLHRPNLTWLRDWHTASQLADEIRAADVCLGIFGDTDKAQRVCPLKIYAYAAIGRAIITGQTEWLKNAMVELEQPPVASVPIGNAKALADSIVELAENPSLRATLAEASRTYYRAALSNQVVNKQFGSYLQSILKA